MQFELKPHPAMPPDTVESVNVTLFMTDGAEMLLRYAVTGSSLLLPEWQSPGRTDGLWQTTCFELFLRSPESEAYFEFNFSPSSQWAAYEFDAYRTGMRALPLGVDPFVDREPAREGEELDADYVLEADVDLAGIPSGPLLIGLAAVIEEESGIKSYWALAHPPGAPDFHHEDCFAVELPAANAR
jgi:hypothetical protein